MIIFNKKLKRFTKNGKIIRTSHGRKSSIARKQEKAFLNKHKTKKQSTRNVITTNKMIDKQLQGLELYGDNKRNKFKVNAATTPYFDKKTKLLLSKKQLPATTTLFNRAMVYYAIEIQVENLPPFDDIWTFEYTAYNHPLTYKQFVKKINANIDTVQKKYLSAITLKHSMIDTGSQKQFYFKGIEAIKLYRGKKPNDKEDRNKSSRKRRNKTSKKGN